MTVFERPGLDEFLTQLSAFADLVLFTAGLEGLPYTYLFSIFVDLIDCKPPVDSFELSFFHHCRLC